MSGMIFNKNFNKKLNSQLFSTAAKPSTTVASILASSKAISNNYNNNNSSNHHHHHSTPRSMKFQNIAPAPGHGRDVGGGDLKSERKYTPRLTTLSGGIGCGVGGGGIANGPYSVDQTQSVQRRNARERNRVKQVNNSFAKLRQHIPQSIILDLTKGGGRGPQKKISKVDTLRIAVEYIRRLQDLVDDLNGGSSVACKPDPLYSASAKANNNNSSNSSSTQSSIGTASCPSSPPPPPPPPLTASAQSQSQSHILTSAQLQMYYANSVNTASTLGSLPAFALMPASTHHHPAAQSHTAAAASASQFSSQPFGGNGNGNGTAAFLQTTAGCHSPTASFSSSMSFDSGTFEPLQQLSPVSGTDSEAHADAHLRLKFEAYDSFNLHEEDCTPDDDEELLDYISLWQEQ